MAFDIQALLAQLGLAGAPQPVGGPMSGTSSTGPIPQGLPQMLPGAQAAMQGPPPAPTGAPPPQSGIGPMGLLGAGASMLGAKGPNMNFGQAAGVGIGGLLGGMGLDRQAAMQNMQQQQAQQQQLQQQQTQQALAQISQRLGMLPTGAQPNASSPGMAAPQGAPTPQGVPGMMPQGAPPSGAAFGGQPPTPPSVPGMQASNTSTNPYIQMMMQRRLGRMA